MINRRRDGKVSIAEKLSNGKLKQPKIINNLAVDRDKWELVLQYNSSLPRSCPPKRIAQVLMDTAVEQLIEEMRMRHHEDA